MKQGTKTIVLLEITQFQVKSTMWDAWLDLTRKLQNNHWLDFDLTWNSLTLLYFLKFWKSQASGFGKPKVTQFQVKSTWLDLKFKSGMPDLTWKLQNKVKLGVVKSAWNNPIWSSSQGCLTWLENYNYWLVKVKFWKSKVSQK